MDKSILTEIDRLEGIAQAYARRRPIVPMTGVLEDIHWARRLVGDVCALDADQESCQERVQEIEDYLLDAKSDLKVAEAAAIEAQADLDRLMASLGARLER